MIRNRRLLTFFLVVASFCLVAEIGRAATINWTNAVGGLFNTTANWSSTVPGSADTAEFNLPSATFTVIFQTNVTNTKFNVDNGFVSFALSGTNYTTTSAGVGDAIGSIAGQTGVLTITDGKITGDLTVGTVAGASGFLTIGSDATWNANGQIVLIGDSGLGSMTINGGGQFVNTTNSVTLGNSATGDGTLVVDGTNSSFASANLTIGSSGFGHATVSGGATAKTQTVVVGSNSNSVGSLTVTGASSLLDTATNPLIVGGSGVGHFLIADGATVNCGQATLGNISLSSGDATITGLGSTWNVSNQLIVGNTGTGTLTIADGGTLNTSGASTTTIGLSAAGAVTLTDQGSTWIARSNIIIGGTGMLTVGPGTILTMPGTGLQMNSSLSTLNLNGGTIDVGGAFSRLGNFNLNDGTLIVRGAFSNGSSQPLIIDGTISTSFPTLELIGNFTASNITMITVGNIRQGALSIEDGRNVNLGANNVSVGAQGGSNGTLTLSGAGTLLSTTAITAVGGSGTTAGGTGLLTISTGASLSTGTFNVFPGGTVILNSGGSINLANLNVFSGTFDFNAGTFNFTTGSPSLTSSQLDFLLGAGHPIGFDRTVSSAGSLTISGPVTVSGGTLSAATGLINASTLTATDGTITTASTLTNNANDLMLISGTGSVFASSGITNNGTIQLNNNLIATSGGTLSNSGTIRGTGFIGNSLTNNAAGQIQMTTDNRLEFQGATNTNTGLISLDGGELVFDGPLTNSSGTGLITGHDAMLRTGGITNNGSLGFTAGTMDVYGKITNNVGGLITCSGGGTTTFYDDVTIAAGASSVRASAVGSIVSRVVFFGSYNGGIVGGGAAFIEGDLRPGNSPGVVSFGGDLVLDGLSQTFIDIGGTTPGFGTGHHDQINVVGNATIGGNLELDPYGGFVPVSGDKFVIMTYGSGTGTFGTVTGTSPAPGLTYTPVYLANSLVVLTTVTGEKTWGVDSDGNASVGSNWIGGVAPGGIGDTATFSTIITAPRTVTLDTNTTLGTVKFDSPISYTIAGPSTLTLQAAGPAAATINDSNVHGNGAHTISAPITLASNLNVTQNSSGSLTVSGPLNDAAGKSIAISGTGVLRFALTSGSPTIAAGVQVTVSGSATLELAGTSSELSSGSNRANIVNTSSATAGIHVTGTNQIVGGIDGSGSLVADAGSSLTANHIIESTLTIGGTAGNPATVTIGVSDASGNPLGMALGTGATPGALETDPPPGASIVCAMPTLSDSQAGNFTLSVISPGGPNSGATEVPEPSAIILLAIGAVTLLRVFRLQFGNRVSKVSA